MTDSRALPEVSDAFPYLAIHAECGRPAVRMAVMPAHGDMLASCAMQNLDGSLGFPGGRFICGSCGRGWRPRSDLVFTPERFQAYANKRAELETRISAIHTRWFAAVALTDLDISRLVAGFMEEVGPDLVEWARVSGGRPADLIPMLRGQADIFAREGGHA